MTKSRLAALVAALCLAPVAFAQVTITEPWVRGTVPAQKATGAFMKITSKQDAKLVGAASPAAKIVEVHEMAMKGNVMEMRAIDALPVWHRSVVMLVDVQGYDYGEAAQILNLPLGTVKSRISRARAALRDELVRTGVVPGRML